MVKTHWLNDKDERLGLSSSPIFMFGFFYNSFVSVIQQFINENSGNCFWFDYVIRQQSNSIENTGYIEQI